jgi:hypothetical protein
MLDAHVTLSCSWAFTSSGTRFFVFLFGLGAPFLIPPRDRHFAEDRHMTDDGSLTRYACDLHAPDPTVRQEAARQLWLRFAGRLRGVVRRRLDPLIAGRVGTGPRHPCFTPRGGPMRTRAAFVLTLAFTLVGGPAVRPLRSVAADAPDLTGTWKLVVLPSGDDEFLILDLKRTDGKLAGTVPSAQTLLGPVKQAEGTAEGDQVLLTFPATGDPLVFRGVAGKDGKALGTVRFRGTTYPARLEKTDARAVAKMQAPPSRRELLKAQALPDAKERVAKVLEVIEQNPGHPMNASAYGLLLSAAEAAGLGPAAVREHVERWIAEANPYGPEWSAEIQSRAVKALQGKKAYAELATELALAADKALPADAALELRGNVVSLLARSARLAGKDEIAAEAESRARVIDAQLDSEYHQKVPPFKPEPFAGRAGGQGNRTVVMEIFTGAECPPCVAADVAFDALLRRYRPTELIGLQYHLHIPGPDPLTNADSVARQGYYGTEVRGTPSTFFNGTSEAGGGGPMGRATAKYLEYCGVIEPALTSEKRADIEVTATRAGDAVKIVARATAAAAAGDAATEAKPKLRLVLIEESVRYPGGNKLRFHHNVVRALPGSVEGKALEDGKGEVEATLRLSDLRQSQDAYLDQYPKSPRGRAFPNPLPPLDLDDLAVVALVQDDADHSIWHAVQVPVKEVKP